MKISQKEKIALPGFEPGSTDPKSAMIDHYTTGLYYCNFLENFTSEKYFGRLCFLVEMVCVDIERGDIGKKRKFPFRE